MEKPQVPEPFSETDRTEDDPCLLPPDPGLAGDPERAMNTCALVLEARGIPFETVTTPEGPRLQVPQASYRAARRELELFAAENRNWPPVLLAAPPPAANVETTLLILALLALFHIGVRGGFADLGWPHFDWVERGLAAAGPLLDGDWWRSVTALTLHADGLHLLGNLLIGAPLVVRLCQELGSGLGWSLVLASGALGNITNALLQSPDHRSLGASTALFGALGILSGLGLVAGRMVRVRRWVLPLAAALALLALLGTGQGRVDVGAHLFGFFWGVVLGIPAGWRKETGGRPGPVFDRLLAWAAAGVVVVAWWAALA